MVQFNTLDEFIDRAEELLYNLKASSLMPFFDLKREKDYIYHGHTFCAKESLDNAMKDKLWEYLMGYKYEKVNINDLKAIRGQICRIEKKK